MTGVENMKINEDYWTLLIREMGLSAMAGQLASHCFLKSLDLKKCTLYLKPKLHFLLSDHAAEKICMALNNHFGVSTIELEISFQEFDAPTPAEIMTKDRKVRQLAACGSPVFYENL